MRVGIAHHLGWAVAVTASGGHVVTDRRRIELIGPGLPAAPVEHEAKALDDAAAAILVGQVREKNPICLGFPVLLPRKTQTYER